MADVKRKYCDLIKIHPFVKHIWIMSKIINWITFFISCQNTTKIATFMYLTEQKENQALLSLFMTLIAIK